MKIPKPKKTVELTTGLHKCPGCLLWYPGQFMTDLAWRRDKIGPYTETVEFCKVCAEKRHANETGERLMYRMREIKTGIDIARNRRKDFGFPQ